MYSFTSEHKLIDIFGLPFNSVQNIDEAIELIFNTSVAQDKLPFVITPNVDQIINLENDKSLKSYLKNSFLIFPDGMPIVWTSKLKKEALPKRISGSDIFPVFWEKVQQKKKKILFIAANNELGEALQQEYQYATYYIPPFFELDSYKYQEVVNNLCTLIKTEKPNFVLMGLSYPKREYLCRSLMECHTSKDIKYLLLGAAPEFHIGIKKRAPLWMQNLGLEWFHRLLSEPKRLFKRYVITIFGFVPILFREWRNK